LAQSVKPQGRGAKKEARGRITRASFTDESNFRVPQGSPPYRQKMPIPHYKSRSADVVKGGWLTLSHQRSERVSFARVAFFGFRSAAVLDGSLDFAVSVAQVFGPELLM
jgi:hypothetical protein